MVRLDPNTLLALVQAFQINTLKNAKSRNLLKNKEDTLDKSVEDVDEKELGKSSKWNKKSKVDKQLVDRLSEITHLHLQRKGISHLDYIKLCKKCQYVFLQENQLKKIGQLKHLHALKEIYVHDNIITRLEGLTHLRHLEKFFGPRNRLSVLEGLPSNLKELDVSWQNRSSKAEYLLLDPQALLNVQNSLTMLDISGNGITEISAVSVLKHLKILRASNNCINALNYTCGVISKLPQLLELDFRGNAVTQYRTYWRKVLFSCQQLVSFDGRDIKAENTKWARNEEIHIQQTRNWKDLPQGKEKAEEIEFDDKHFMFSNPHPLYKGRWSLGNHSGFVLDAMKKDEFSNLLQNLHVESSISDKPMVSEPTVNLNSELLTVTAKSVNSSNQVQPKINFT